MTPPLMAQGTVQGIRDAQNLAWKLDRVLKGKSADALLDSYGQERHPHVTATTKKAIALGRVICERDADRANERDARLLAEHDGEVPTTVRQNMIPNLTGELFDKDSPGAGCLIPQPWVHQADGATVLLDDMTGPTVRVVMNGRLSADEATGLSAALGLIGGRLLIFGETNEALSADVLHVQEAGPVIGPWLDRIGMRVAIVRPDHYVFSTAADLPRALSPIERLRGPLHGGM